MFNDPFDSNFWIGENNRVSSTNYYVELINYLIRDCITFIQNRTGKFRLILSTSFVKKKFSKPGYLKLFLFKIYLNLFELH